jgi:hypothetical protein
MKSAIAATALAMVVAGLAALSACKTSEASCSTAHECPPWRPTRT